jgi:hypothetical protein
MLYLSLRPRRDEGKVDGDSLGMEGSVRLLGVCSATSTMSYLLLRGRRAEVKGIADDSELGGFVRLFFSIM